MEIVPGNGIAHGNEIDENVLSPILCSVDQNPTIFDNSTFGKNSVENRTTIPETSRGHKKTGQSLNQNQENDDNTNDTDYKNNSSKLEGTNSESDHVSNNENFYDQDDGNPFDQAIPIDKLKNGAKTALDMFSWGFSVMKEKADEYTDNALENMSKGISDAYDNPQESVDKLRKGATNVFEQSKVKLSEFQESATATLETVTIKTIEGFSLSKQKVEEISEACIPAIERTTESTKEALAELMGRP